jgi:hypothetical protein
VKPRTIGRSSGRRATRIVAAVVVLVAVSTGLATPAFAQIPSPNYYDPTGRCKIPLIYVRGTGEAAGVGSANGGRTYQYGGAGQVIGTQGFEGAMLADSMIPTYEEAILYPAVAFTTQANYFQSEAVGVTQLRAEIENLVSTCGPAVNIQLAGYSQGAHVIGDVLDVTSPTQLSAAAKHSIGGVVLWGDPTYRPGEAWDATGNGTLPGFFGSRAAGAFAPYVRTVWPWNSPGPYSTTTVRSYCTAGDAWCQHQWPAGQAIHQNYNTAAGWPFVSQFLIAEG